MRRICGRLWRLLRARGAALLSRWVWATADMIIPTTKRTGVARVNWFWFVTDSTITLEAQPPKSTESAPEASQGEEVGG